MEDKEIHCRCGAWFVFTAGEQKFFAEREFPDPKRCPDCRINKRFESGAKQQ